MKIPRRVLRITVLGVIALGIVVAVTIGVLDYLSWKTVTFKLSPETKSVTIYHAISEQEEDSGLVEAASISSSGSMRLKTGSYVALAKGDTVSNTKIPFTVTGNTSVDIQPYYSDEYLSKTFGGELTAINAVLTTKYPFVTNGYTIDTGHFYHFGDWYGTTLYNSSPGPGDGVDIYGVLLHKTDGVWSVVNAPTLVFTYATFSSVPKDIVDSANQQLFGL